MKIAFVRENQQIQKNVRTMFFNLFSLGAVFLMCRQQGFSVAFLDAEKNL